MNVWMEKVVLLLIYPLISKGVVYTSQLKNPLPVGPEPFVKRTLKCPKQLKGMLFTINEDVISHEKAKYSYESD